MFEYHERSYLFFFYLSVHKFKIILICNFIKLRYLSDKIPQNLGNYDFDPGNTILESVAGVGNRYNSPNIYPPRQRCPSLILKPQHLKTIAPRKLYFNFLFEN